MKLISGVALILALAASLSAFWQRDAAWPCSAEFSMPEVVKPGPNSVELHGGGVRTNGDFISSGRMVLGGATAGLPIYEIDLFGVGEYRFKYVGKVKHLRVRVAGRDAYVGAPIESLNAGPGWLGIVAEGEGPMTVVAEDRCSIRTQWRGLVGPH